MNDPKQEGQENKKAFEKVSDNQASSPRNPSNPVTNPSPPSPPPPPPLPEGSTEPKKRRWFSEKYKLPRRIFFTLVIIPTLFVLCFLFYVSFDLPPMAIIENPKSDQSTQLISSDGVVLQKYYSRENRVNVSLEEISPYVIDALIATEDVRFRNHSGIDPMSFFTIFYELIKSGDARGGSTITMQLARNLYAEVGNQKLIVRKPKEYLVSAYLERRFTKEEIIAAYLNTVNIYGNSYGIETTANRLFDKSAKELNLEESALIVGMLKGQGVYNPFRRPENALKRRNTVLNLMRDNGYLDLEAAALDSIKAIPLEESLVEQEELHIRGLAPYFREHVRQFMNEWCKKNGYDLYRDGLRVYTTLDSRMQAYAEEAVQDHLKDLQATFDKVEKRGERSYKRNPGVIEDLKKQSQRYINAKKAGKSDSEIDAEFRKKRKMKVFTWGGDQETEMSPLDSIKYYARFLEVGMVSIDPLSGHVKAWVGGNDFKYFQYDHVAQGKRQVGSTFKPFLYGAVLDAGYPVCYEVLNQPVTVPMPDGSVWSPNNSDFSKGGFVTIKKALASSMNSVSARLITKEVNPTLVAEFAKKAGIDTKLDEVYSLALGTTDLSVFEMTKAYSAFANMGTKVNPIFVTRIEDRSGTVLAEFQPDMREVINPEVAYKVVNLMQGVVDQGTAVRLRYKYKFKNQIAAKTGTTQNQSDGWFMGLTPDLVTGVWVGHQDRRVHFSSIKYGQGANMSLPIWAEYMQRVYKDREINLPQDPFPIPESLKEDLVCRTKAETEVKEDDGPQPDDLDGF
ncbi:MAG: transglycosylase domain-containing protein [Bacteroidota bacterium]